MNLLNKLSQTKKIKGKQETYDFQIKENFVSGFCPDCGEVVAYVPKLDGYVCLNCNFQADKNKERVWDNNQEEKLLYK